MSAAFIPLAEALAAPDFGWAPSPGFLPPHRVGQANVAQLIAFDAKVEPCPITGCWIWVAAHNGPYGVLNNEYAHRFSYRAFRASITERQVTHLCNNQWCVNPEHLTPASPGHIQLKAVKRGTHGKARRTKCARGHPYTPKNVYLLPAGHRDCRACIAIRRRALIDRRRSTDPKFVLNARMSTSVRTSLKKRKAWRQWQSIVGYTVDELATHLKKTVPTGYSWNDFLRGKLHIDHKVPLVVFNFASAEDIDFKRAWALNNLQLLPPLANLQKKDKLFRPFQPSLKGV